MDDFLVGLRKISEIGIALAAISFIFYFIGYIYQASFFTTLGISHVFLDFSYEGNVIGGVIEFLPIMVFAPFFLDWYLVIKSLEKEEMN